MSRRRIVPLTALAAAWFIAGASPASSQSSPPAMPSAHEHIKSATTGPIVESVDALKVTSTIQCWCGGCVNQTLHECTCGLAAAERANVAASLSAGRTPDQLIAAYVAEHGAQVRLVPEKRGVNLIGWAIPFAASLAAVIGLTMVLRVWSRRTVLQGAAAGTAPGGPGAAPAAEAAYRTRIARDLKEYDR